VRRNTLLIDAGMAAALAILVLIIAPGLAVVGLLGILVIVACAISFAFDRRRRRRLRRVDIRVSHPPRRAPRQPRPRSRH
jgi:ABC-type bacteriocin/lantibiotic exporter with double-glycine peptidase domain